jgi:glycolate oxidase FAD binding subunit
MAPPEPTTGYPIGDGRLAAERERPEALDALRATVARRVEAGQAIYPQGGGTALDYGGTPTAPGVAIDTTALARVLDYPAADMTITVEAGMSLRRLQEILGAHNQRLPLDAPCDDRATLGGIFATNTSGPRRYGAGRPRDHIIGIGFVTADGKLIRGGGRVVKNVAGYDFPKLLTGSLGTLGVIAEMTFKVRPRPETGALVWLPVDQTSELAARLDALNTSATRPMAVELLNRPAARRVGAAWNLPVADWVLVVGYEDNAAAVTWQVERLRAEIAAAGLQVVRASDDATPDELIWTGLGDGLAGGSGMGPLQLVANIRPSGVAAFGSRLDPERWLVQAHAGNGIVRAQAVGEWGIEEAGSLLAELRREAVSQGGNVILARCPVEWKPILGVWGEPRGDRDVMARIRQAFDPTGLMNPGRFA